MSSATLQAIQADQEYASAKINLFLHVTGKRDDGYHLLDSLAVFPPIGDLLQAEPACDLSLTIKGPFADGLSAGPDNLVLRAASLLADAAHVAPGARLSLTKNLPVASGIGGGSADAAAALRLLSRLWNINEDLLPIAAKLGADVPVCIAATSARMGGIGEILKPAPRLPDYGILLVNPGIAVATATVFRARHAAFSPMADLPAGWPDAHAMAADLAALQNDLQAPAIALEPVIADVIAALTGTPDCLLARMSGSGATCFALYPSRHAAAHAATLLARPGWWIAPAA